MYPDAVGENKRIPYVVDIQLFVLAEAKTVWTILIL